MRLPPLSKLPQEERQQLLDDLNYLNTAEIKSFCKRHGIPYTIAIETGAGDRRKTNEDDRKGIILNRIRHFLETGEILEETCFRGDVVCLSPPLDKPGPADRLFYGQYDKTNQAMIDLLKSVTNGKFRNGAIARILARKFWSSGKAPTFEEFGSAWLQAVNDHISPNPEWAFLSDKARGTTGPDWKKLRARKAAKVMKLLRIMTS